MDMTKAASIVADAQIHGQLDNLDFEPPSTVKLFHKIGTQDTTVQDMLVGMSPEQVYAKLATDLNFLSKFLLGDVFKYDWPPLIVAVWSLLIQSLASLQDYAGEANLAIGIPRGFAKSTLMKVFCCYCLMFTRHTFILVIGNVDANAANIIKDIQSMLDSDHAIRYFGSPKDDVHVDRQDFKHFIYQGKSCIMKAKGGRTSVRGINVDHRRPDVILMDDVQDEENAKSEIESEALSTWIVGTLLPTVSHNGAINLFVGNTYDHEGSILKKLVRDPEWVSLTLAAILDDGTSLWPQLHPVVKLLSSYRSACRLGHERSWLAQYMNALDSEQNDSFDAAAMVSNYDKRFGYSPNIDLMSMASARYIIIDPASTKKNADDHAITVNYVVDDTPIVRKVVNGVMNPMEAIINAIVLALQYGATYIFVEDVAYQDTLLWWFRKVIEADTQIPQLMKDQLKVLPCSPARGNKNTRILHMFKQITHGGLLIHPDAQAKVKAEGIAFDKMKTNNTDNIIDACHYALPVYVANRHSLHDAAYEYDIAASKHSHEIALASHSRNQPL